MQNPINFDAQQIINQVSSLGLMQLNQNIQQSNLELQNNNVLSQGVNFIEQESSEDSYDDTVEAI